MSSSNESVNPQLYILLIESEYLEVTVGLEPTHESFADSCLSQLGYVTKYAKILA